MPAYCLIRLAGATTLLNLATAFVAFSLFAFSLAHCVETRSWSRSLAMLAVAFAIALTMEYLGSAHGFVFGSYTYADKLEPKVLNQVPVIIPIAWFMMLYPAWETAGVLVRGFNTESQRSRGIHCFTSVSLLLRVAIAALAMTAWDLSLDPRMVADGAWVWRNGGAYFGIPLTNFAGWFITSALIYALWTKLEGKLVMPRLGEASLQLTGQNENSARRLLPPLVQHATLPIVAYIVQWLGESVANAVFWGGPLLALCVFVGMGTVALPATILLLRRHALVQKAVSGVGL